MSMYESPIALDPEASAPPRVLRRLPLAAPDGLDEARLRDLLFRFPEALPVAAIDPACAPPIPVCRELTTPAGYVDALYASPRGRLVLAEFKLWRNPQARREVIGRILDYAKELASWGYEDLQREISRTLQKPGNVLYDLARAGGAEIDEAEFADNVARCLRRGEFLLLIVGDGIREDTARIVDFVQRHAGLHFNLAPVEAAIYRGGDGGLLVQPRVLAKTVLLRRTIIESAAPEPERGADAPLSDEERENLRFWISVLRGFVFSDVTVEPPAPAGEPGLFVRVRNSGFGDWGLCFGVRARRRQRLLDCYLTRRSDLGPGLARLRRTRRR